MPYETVLINRYKDFEEISIRQEVDDFFSGFDYGEPKDNPFVVKKIRRNSTFEPVKCRCWDNIHNEGIRGCYDCGGSGYKNDEYLIVGYLSNLQTKRHVDSYTYKDTPGRTVEIAYLFYTRHQDVFREGDILLKPVLTDEGFIQLPIEYTEEYLITAPFNNRLDEGRSEFHLYSLIRTR